MDEYINATTLLKEIDYAFHTDIIGKKDVINLIVNLPVADITPVLHGRWVHHIAGGKQISACWCSVCNVEHETEQNYCPNCGAKMDGGAE